MHSAADSGVVRRPFSSSLTQCSRGGGGEGALVLKFKLLWDLLPSRICLVSREERGDPGKETEYMSPSCSIAETYTPLPTVIKPN